MFPDNIGMVLFTIIPGLVLALANNYQTRFNSYCMLGAFLLGIVSEM